MYSISKKKLFLALGATCVSAGVYAVSDGKQPMNIIFIMSDDHSSQTISAYSDKFIQTPNIDRLADEGVRFTNSFVANSISGPSRACMLTGKHSHANGFLSNRDKFDGSQQTFPKLLQKNGYQTAIIGKWHLTSEPTGFDYWDILVGQGTYYNPMFIKEGVKTKREGYATNIITDVAIDWIESIKDADRPFCLILNHKAPHRSWMPDLCDLGHFDGVDFELPDNFYDNYHGRTAASQQKMSIEKDMDLVYDLKLADKQREIKSPLGGAGRSMYNRMTKEQRETWNTYYTPIIEEFKRSNLSGSELTEWKYQQYMRDYLSVILSVDRNIGRVLDYLQSSGMLENTMVVYTSDQGFYMGEHGWFDKRFMYEESFRTPLLIRMPGGVRGDVEQLVQNIDYAPTILELAGVEIPEDIQGESMISLLRGEKSQDWRESLYYHYYEYPGPHSVKRHYGVRTDRYKLIHFYNDIDSWEFYDLKKDPAEMNNLYLEPKMQKEIKKIKLELLKLQKQYKDPIKSIL